MENSRAGNKELLVAWCDEGCGEVCERVQFMSENEEQDGGTGGKVEVE